MASPLLLRDGENVSGDMIQRILGLQFAKLTGISGVGTGFAPGGVGVQNANWTSGTPTGHFVVTATGTTMVLTIAPGWGIVVRDAGGSSLDPRAVMAELQASTTVTVSANSTGSTRNDTVCLKVDMNTAPSADGSNLVSAVILAGASGGALPNAPADGNLYLPLANIAVANGATSIAQGNVTDKRTTAADYNLYKFRAHMASTATTFASGATLTMDTKDYDPNGNFATATGLFTAPVSGYYSFNGNAYLNSTAIGRSHAILTYAQGSGSVAPPVTASTGPDQANGIASSGSFVSGAVSDIVFLNAGNTAGLSLFYSQAGPIASVGALFTWFTGHLLSPA